MLTRREFIQTSGASAASPFLLESAFAQQPAAASVVFANFESGTFDGWTLEGNCWGSEPATDQTFGGAIKGFEGKRYLCSFHPQLGGKATGKATSKEFVIEQPFINFLIGGGKRPGEACINLVVDGKVVRTATGNGRRTLDAASWDVSLLQRKNAHFEIVDRSSDPNLGYIIVDEIRFGTHQSALEWIILPVHAIQLSDDNGQRTAEISFQDVTSWVDYANTVYASARIRFTFHANQDTSTLNSTLLNNMMGTGDVTWNDEKRLGNEISAKFPGKVVLLVRHGPGVQPVGGGFSWTDYNFIALSRAGSSTPNVLAHEAGHYLGLAHTFNRIFKTVAEAEQFIVEHGYRDDMFDGDGLSDTPPTPFIEELAITTRSMIIIAGHRFDIQVGNINSFYNGPPPMRGNTLSPMQIDIVRHVASVRLKNRMVVAPGLEQPKCL